MESNPLTFKDLAVGERFVDFPTDGDDSGHGGFKAGAYLFIKSSEFEAFRILDGNKSVFNQEMEIYKIIF